MLQWPTWNLVSPMALFPAVWTQNVSPWTFMKRRLRAAFLTSTIGMWDVRQVSLEEPVRTITPYVINEAKRLEEADGVQHLWFLNSLVISWLAFPFVNRALSAVS